MTVTAINPMRRYASSLSKLLNADISQYFATQRAWMNREILYSSFVDICAIIRPLVYMTLIDRLLTSISVQSVILIGMTLAAIALVEGLFSYLKDTALSHLAEASWKTLEEQARRRLTLVERGIMPRNTGDEAQRTASLAEAEMVDAQMAVEQAELALSQARAQIPVTLSQIDAQFMSEARGLNEQRAELVAAKTGIDNIRGSATLRAPLAGYLEATQPVFVDRPVTAGQELYQLTPPSTEFFIRATVRNEDIGRVRPGDQARINLKPLIRDRFRRIVGTVTRVSDDPVPAPPAMMMLDPELRRGPEYIVEIEFEDAPLDMYLSMKNGMSVEVDILVGKRRIWQYFLASLSSRVKPVLAEP